jgi:hypothetical protein
MPYAPSGTNMNRRRRRRRRRDVEYANGKEARPVWTGLGVVYSAVLLRSGRTLVAGTT